MPTTVVLSWGEVWLAASTAVMRQIQNLKAGRPDRFGCDPADGWSVHVEGACGEFAVAKLTKQFWSGSLGNLAADDVGMLQVRTRARHTYDLIIHPTDADDRKFVLVTGVAPTFAVHGWISGQDGKQQRFWKDPAGGRPAYFVPQSALKPLETLGVDEVAP